MRGAASRRSLPPPRNLREVLLAWGPALLYMALIFVVSSMRVDTPVIDAFPLRDKGIHFVEYAVLGFFCAHATLRLWPEKQLRRTLTLGAFVAAAWGLSDELHQALVPYRYAEVGDLIADALGASAGAGLRGVVHRWRR